MVEHFSDPIETNLRHTLLNSPPDILLEILAYLELNDVLIFLSVSRAV